MPRYVAFLRGINVGGRHRLPMKDPATPVERGIRRVLVWVYVIGALSLFYPWSRDVGWNRDNDCLFFMVLLLITFNNSIFY